MKAMIFAAGRGTRLRPLTETRPKALVEVGGKPLLEWVLLKLKAQGFREIIINTHHLGEQIEALLKAKNNFGIRIALSPESDELLDTGGGLRKAAWFFDDGQPFLVHNVDVLSDLDLQEVLRYHEERKPLATLVVRPRPSSRQLLFEPQTLQLVGWKNHSSGQTRWVGEVPSKEPITWAFSGIQIVEPRIFAHFPIEKSVFSIIEVYLEAARKEKVSAFLDEDSAWLDVGKPASLPQAEKLLAVWNSRENQ